MVGSAVIGEGQCIGGKCIDCGHVIVGSAAELQRKVLRPFDADAVVIGINRDGGIGQTKLAVTEILNITVDELRAQIASDAELIKANF